MRANYFSTPNAPDRFYRHCLLIRRKIMLKKSLQRIINSAYVIARTARGDNNNNNTHLFSPLSVNKFKSFFLNLPYKHMVNASSCTVELWMHLGDSLGGVLSSQELAKYNLLTASAYSMRICSTLALVSFIRRNILVI